MFQKVGSVSMKNHRMHCNKLKKKKEDMHSERNADYKYKIIKYRKVAVKSD